MRYLLLTITLILIGGFVLVFSIGCSLSGPRYQGTMSNHFDSKRFHNQQPLQHAGVSDFLYWMLHREPGPWREWTDAAPGALPPPHVTDGRLRVTFVNHSTVLVQMEGLNMLTDPIWSERASPFSWIGPRRVRPPGIRFEDLPPIHVVMISHNHYDHLDLPTLIRLAKEHHPQFIVGLGNAALLESAGIVNIQELDWWQSTELAEGVCLTSTPGQHFAARSLFDRDATLWTGYVVQGTAGAIYFAGDTGYGPHFVQIRERFGPLRLAMLPIGAFRPAWFMSRVHLSPSDAVQAHYALDASTSLAIHYGTFRLGDDGQDEPVETLTQVIKDHGDQTPRFWALDFGEGREVPPVSGD